MKFYKISKRISVLGISAVLSFSSLILSTNAFAASNLSFVSVNDSGQQGSGHSESARISDDGRIVVFTSYAGNFASGDNNGQPDIYVRDRLTRTTTIVSKSSNGVISNGYSSGISISSNGRFITFQSTATNLVVGDTNGRADVFMHDRQTGLTTLESVADDESLANNSSGVSSVSNDGRFIAFDSAASNLVSDDTNGSSSDSDVFLRDRQQGTTTRLSINNQGAQGNQTSRFPSITPDGHFVIFNSRATNLIADDTNSGNDVFLRDLVGGTISRVSLGDGGTQANFGISDRFAFLSDDANRIVFTSSSTNLVTGPYTYINSNVFMHDRASGITKLVSKGINNNAGNWTSEEGAISADGQHVVYSSCASNLVLNDDTISPNCNIFRWNSVSEVNERLSLTVNPAARSNGASLHPDLSGDGSSVVFGSHATNLINPDGNGGLFDIFLWHVPEFVPPVVTGVPDRSTNTNGWYNADVSIDWTSVDPLPSSGVPNDPPDTLASIEGSDINYTSEQSCDLDANCATGVFTLSIDKSAPAITASVSPASSAYGWNKSDTTVTFTCSDAISGIDFCTAPVTLSSEGDSQQVSGTAVDKAGNTTNIVVIVRIDKTNPTASFSSTTPFLKRAGQTQTITVLANDSLSGVAGGEFYIDTDPGQGNGVPMSVAGASITGTMGTNIPFGMHTVYVRSLDKAGNWSSVISRTLIVIL